MAPKCRNELVPNSSELAFRRLGGKLTPSGRTRVWASNCTIRRVADGMVAESRSFLCLVLWSSSSEGEGQNTGLTYHALGRGIHISFAWSVSPEIVDKCDIRCECVFVASGYTIVSLILWRIGDHRLGLQEVDLYLLSTVVSRCYIHSALRNCARSVMMCTVRHPRLKGLVKTPYSVLFGPVPFFALALLACAADGLEGMTSARPDSRT